MTSYVLYKLDPALSPAAAPPRPASPRDRARVGTIGEVGTR